MLKALLKITPGNATLFNEHQGKTAISAGELAKSLGVSTGTIREWARGADAARLPEFTETGVRVWRKMGTEKSAPKIFFVDGLKAFFGPKPGSEADKRNGSAA